MECDSAYFEFEALVLERLENPFDPKVLAMPSVRSVDNVSGLDPRKNGAPKGTILELFLAILWQLCH
jgi:hypothetical protein